MRRTLLLILVLSLTAVACSQVDGTGRSQFLITSAEEENKLGTEAYAELKTKEKRSTDPVATALIERVGRRLSVAAPDKGFTYEYMLIDSPTVNAFCLPGGKIAFYTGILGYCENEAAVATVMGHEIAHAIARHGGERMSQGTIFQGLQQGLGVVLEAKGVAPSTGNIAMTAFGLGSQFGVMLPFSRKHESEADYLGLTYMAKAGYDPEEAVRFWNRFSALSSGTPTFMSTHPNSADRATALNGYMAMAKNLYAQAGEKHGLGEMIDARYLPKK